MLYKLNSYKLTLAQQKEYMFVMHLAQNPACLMAGFKRMEMELYVSVNNLKYF